MKIKEIINENFADGRNPQVVAESLNVDVPNEEWLQDAIDYAKSKSPDRNGLPYMGKTTATVRNVDVPLRILRRIPGMRQEQSRVRHHDLAVIRKIMSTTGKLPLHGHTGQEYKPFINVAYDGSAWVNEGNHRIMAAAELGWETLPVEISYFDGGERVESGTMYPPKIGLGQVAETFNKPYKTKLEKSEYGDIDMLAELPDGTNLSIMFNNQQDDEGNEIVQVQFYRNNSQEVTGEGDAQRIFATVLTSIQKYIKKYKPARLSFSASKDNWAKQQQNSESRTKLYDRLVWRYAQAWGYRAFRADTGNLVIYELSRLAKGVAEGELEEDWKSALATGAMAGAMAMGANAKAPQMVHQLVEPGDTVYSIARQNNVNPLEIYKLNKMNRNTKLEIGQKVLVPDYSKPVSKMPATVQPAVKQEPAKVAQPTTSFKDKLTSMIPKFSRDEEDGVILLSNNSDAEAALQTAAKAAGLKGVELAQFMAQTRHESWDFSKMKEVGNKKKFDRYEKNRSLAKQLGNKVKGDGELFKGRGPMQLTGRDNYTKASQQIFGDDRLVKHPDLVSNSLEVGAKVALWYWKNRVRPKVDDFNNTVQVVKAINANEPKHVVQQRHTKFKEYLAVL